MKKVNISQDGKKVTYTCKKCGTEQTHNWYGSEAHYCIKCGAKSAIKK